MAHDSFILEVLNRVKNIVLHIKKERLLACELGGHGPQSPPLDPGLGMGRVLHLGPSWHGPSFKWAGLACAELVLGRVVPCTG